MLYLWLKYIHVLSSTILFGTGIGTACNLFLAHHTRDVRTIAIATRYVVFADWMFTTTSGIVQLITGFWMVYLAGYAFSNLWVIGSIIGYAVALVCWLPVVYLQYRMRDFAQIALKSRKPLPPIYFRYYKIWFILGWPAFASLLIVFYLMINKPV